MAFSKVESTCNAEDGTSGEQDQRSYCENTQEGPLHESPGITDGAILVMFLVGIELGRRVPPVNDRVKHDRPSNDDNKGNSKEGEGEDPVLPFDRVPALWISLTRHDSTTRCQTTIKTHHYDPRKQELLGGVRNG